MFEKFINMAMVAACVCVADVESVEEGDEDDEMELSHFMEPASHRMASGLGIGARDMQLRKASLFGSDDMSAEGEVII